MKESRLRAKKRIRASNCFESRNFHFPLLAYSPKFAYFFFIDILHTDETAFLLFSAG
jgi:hypothetical protein